MHLCLQSRSELGEPVLCYSAVCVCRHVQTGAALLRLVYIPETNSRKGAGICFSRLFLLISASVLSLFLSLIISNKGRSAARRYLALKTHVRDVKTQVIVGLSAHQVRSWANPSAGYAGA